MNRIQRWQLPIVFVVALAVFAATAYPSITWWDSASYSLAAVTLGVTPPPGSLLLTLLGWAVTRLPIGLAPAHLLNLLAGVLAAGAVAMVFIVALRLLRRTAAAGGPRANDRAAAAGIGAALGALTFAFGPTLWEYAVRFTPYVLTTVFTGLILWAMVRWWEEAERSEAWPWLVVLGLLFGLDFSVHRTNLLLLPALFAWILLRRPRTLASARAWAAGVGATIVGLSFHLLVMPLAAAAPMQNVGDPSTWSRFYNYVSLAQYGGGWLVQFFPRHAPFWSTQVMDFLQAFSANFLSVRGPLGVVGVAPALFAVVGLVVLWGRERRLGIAFAVLLVVHAVVTVLYFNIPANFFRSLHRHYLPVFVIVAVLAAYGMGTTMRAVWNLAWAGEWRFVVPAGILLAIVPASQLARNWTATDGSGRHFAEDFATNALLGVPPNAVLFTFGDNDTWPLLFVQVVGHVRPDVQIVNIPLTNTDWYVEQLLRRDPNFPLTLSHEAREALSARPWSDTTIAISVAGSPADFGLPADVTLPDSIVLDAVPTMGGRYVLRQDLILLHILEDNHWGRPLCFMTTVGEQTTRWLEPYRRLDGLFWRIVPLADPPPNDEFLGHNLLELYRYRGYASGGPPLDDASRGIGGNYYEPFLLLMQADVAAGAPDRCEEVRRTLLNALPPSRLTADGTVRHRIDRTCEPGAR